MKRSIICCSALLLILTMFANPAWTQGRGKGKPKRKSATASQAVVEVSVVFTTQERGIISDWFATNYSGLPPGLAKRETLPPGLQRQLRRNGTLPPGLQKKLHPFPYALERRLPRLPADYSRVIIGGSIEESERDSSVLPLPGGPIIIILCPPAVATSKARLTCSCPLI